MLKTYTLIECSKVQPNIWILKGHRGIGFGFIGTVAALVRQGLISCDCGQPVFEDKYVYTFLHSDRTSCVYPSFVDCLRACSRDPQIDKHAGLALVLLNGMRDTNE